MILENKIILKFPYFLIKNNIYVITHLGSYVVRGAAEGLCGLVTHNIFLAHAKVRYLHMPIRIQQDVIQLEIPVQDTFGVEEEKSRGYFSGIESTK